jgi:hypothetical protein
MIRCVRGARSLGAVVAITLAAPAAANACAPTGDDCVAIGDEGGIKSMCTYREDFAGDIVGVGTWHVHVTRLDGTTIELDGSAGATVVVPGVIGYGDVVELVANGGAVRVGGHDVSPLLPYVPLPRS